MLNRLSEVDTLAIGMFFFRSTPVISGTLPLRSTHG
jgi:hypothetical protein